MKAIVTSLRSGSPERDLLAFQSLLEGQGAEVVNLGNGIPVDAIVKACQSVRPDLLVVSSLDRDGAPEARELLEVFDRESSKDRLPVVVGGRLAAPHDSHDSHDSGEEASRDLLECGFARVFTGGEAVPQFIDFVHLLRGALEREEHLGNAVWKRTIGIVGGMGPFAHIELENRILEAAEKKLGYTPIDQEFPPWIVASLPQTPNRTSAILAKGPCPVPYILKCLQVLESADFALIPCNTAHAFIPRLRREASVPILDIVSETISYVQGRFGNEAKVGLLASSGTLATGIYQRAARLLGGVQVLTPLGLGDGEISGHEMQEQRVMGAIYGRQRPPDDLQGGIKSGAHRNRKLREKIRSELTDIILRFRDQGAVAVILGCTELPLVLGRESIHGLAAIDPLAVAASAAVDVAAGDRPLSSLP